MLKKDYNYQQDFDRCLRLMNRRKDIFQEIKNCTTLKDFTRLVIEDRVISAYLASIYRTYLNKPHRS